MSYPHSRHYFGARRNDRQDQVLLLIGSSLACLVVGIAVTFAIIESAKTKPVPVSDPVPPQGIEVIIPKVDIMPGSALLPSLFEKTLLPTERIPSGALRSLEELHQMFAKTILLQGEPITIKHMQNAPSLNSIIERIPSGYRAVTIRVDARTAVEGWAIPGAHVDVLWDTTVKNKASVVTLVEDAKVLSTERSTDTRQESSAVVPSTVTLLVQLADAEKIHYASRSGSLSLSLRGMDPDPVRIKKSPTNIDTIVQTEPEESKDPLISGELTIGNVKYAITVNGKLVRLE